jgi:hypothetical protein
MQIRDDSLDLALEHIEHRGDTDIFPLPFEFFAIRHQWTDIKSFIRSKDLRQWNTQPYIRCLAPKGHLGFRVATQLDPLDAIVFTALGVSPDNYEKSTVRKVTLENDSYLRF